MDWAVEVLGWTDIIHTIDPANAPLDRAGPPHRRDEPRTGRLPPPVAERRFDVWGQTAAEWRARRPSFG